MTLHMYLQPGRLPCYFSDRPCRRRRQVIVETDQPSDFPVARAFKSSGPNTAGTARNLPIPGSRFFESTTRVGDGPAPGSTRVAQA